MYPIVHSIIQVILQELHLFLQLEYFLGMLFQ